MDLDADTRIDTLQHDTSWSTIYVRVSHAGVQVERGTRIVCECEAVCDKPLPSYSVCMLVGEAGHEVEVGRFSWSGCG